MAKRSQNPAPPFGGAGRIPISYSSGKLFEQCPARFQAEKVEKMGRGGGMRPIHLTTGVFLHEVLDLYHKHLIATKQSTDLSSGEKIFETAWADPVMRAGIPADLHPELHEIWAKTLQMVNLTVGDVVGSEIAIALDDNWEKTEWSDPAALWRGKIDLLMIDGDWHAVVWDYKTGQKIVGADESMQMKIYAAVIKALFPQVQEISVILSYPRFYKENRHEIDESDITEARRWIADISAQIDGARKTNNWPAKVGTACADCPIFNRCPARAVAASSLPPMSQQEAEALLSRLILLERERKDVKDKLQTWCTLNGSVVVGGMVIGFGTKSLITYDVDQLTELLKNNGIDPDTILKADNRALEKAAKGKPELVESLKAIAYEKTHSEFRLGKVE